jgi:hypothetical protein
VSGLSRFDWQGHLLGLMAAGAVGWFFESTNAFPGSHDANWAAPLAIYFLGATGLHLIRRLRPGPEGRAGLTTGEMHADRLADAEARLDQLEAAHARISELEERLDFAERLLGSGNPPAVPAHETEAPR